MSIIIEISRARVSFLTGWGRGESVQKHISDFLFSWLSVSKHPFEAEPQVIEWFSRLAHQSGICHEANWHVLRCVKNCPISTRWNFLLRDVSHGFSRRGVFICQSSDFIHTLPREFERQSSICWWGFSSVRVKHQFWSARHFITRTRSLLAEIATCSRIEPVFFFRTRCFLFYVKLLRTSGSHEFRNKDRRGLDFHLSVRTGWRKER